MRRACGDRPATSLPAHRNADDQGPRDLFNLLRCVGHPAARSFISFAKRYCDAYRNDYGRVTDGASNLDELNLLMKEVSLRRLKDEVLDLPPKVRSWVPVAVDSPAALNAQRAFAQWFAASDASRPNDTAFLAHLMKVRVALHKAKHNAVEERVKDVLATGQKVIVGGHEMRAEQPEGDAAGA